MATFRTLHSFAVTLDKEVDETVTREENGQKISVTTKVVKPQEYTVILKDLSRSERNELSFFGDVQYGQAIEKGLLPLVAMQRKINKSDGQSPISEDEDKNLTALGLEVNELETKFLSLKARGDSSPEESALIKQQKEEVLQEYLVKRRKHEEMTAAYESLYSHTAEIYKRNKMTIWLTLFQTYIKDPNFPSDSAPRPLFPGDTFEKREEKLNEMDDTKEKLFVKIMEQLPVYWILYVRNQITTAEEFKKFDERWKQEESLRKEAEQKDKTEVPADTYAGPVLV